MLGCPHHRHLSSRLRLALLAGLPPKLARSLKLGVGHHAAAPSSPGPAVPWLPCLSSSAAAAAAATAGLGPAFLFLFLDADCFPARASATRLPPDLEELCCLSPGSPAPAAGTAPAAAALGGWSGATVSESVAACLLAFFLDREGGRPFGAALSALPAPMAAAGRCCRSFRSPAALGGRGGLPDTAWPPPAPVPILPASATALGRLAVRLCWREGPVDTSAVSALRMLLRLLRPPAVLLLRCRLGCGSAAPLRTLGDAGRWRLGCGGVASLHTLGEAARRRFFCSCCRGSCGFWVCCFCFCCFSCAPWLGRLRGGGSSPFLGPAGEGRTWAPG